MTRPSDLLLDVSRLIWRFWRGGLPTGIDRVCLAYIDHYRANARAVAHYNGAFRVLSRSHSDRLFDALLSGAGNFRSFFVKYAPRAFAAATRLPPEPGMLYLNIGHTGVDADRLPRWIAAARVKAVHFVHDLIPLLHPEYCRDGEYPKHEKRMVNVLSSASGLIANSSATLDDLARFAADRGLPMPPGRAAWLAGAPIVTTAEPVSLERPHFVCVGTIEGRKNHSLLLHVWQRLARQLGDETPKLVLVGQRGWEAGHAIAMLDRAVELRGHVLELGRCGDEEMAGLIAGARALLMPSFAEGFGMPVAEALELGAPVIASNLPVFHEFAGDIPTYLDPIDGPAWHLAIIDFLGRSPERERQLDAMRGYHSPTWEDHFARVDQWLGTLA